MNESITAMVRGRVMVRARAAVNESITTMVMGRVRGRVCAR